MEKTSEWKQVRDMKYFALKEGAPTELEKENQKVVREMIPECMVLLKNDGTLPLNSSREKRIALYGNGARNTVKGGTGSGEVNAREITSVENGLKSAGVKIVTDKWLDEYDEILNKAQEEYFQERSEYTKKTGVPIGLAMEECPFKEPMLPRIERESIRESNTDTAIYVLARNSGEGHDRWCVPGDYLLSENEESTIRFLANRYERFILLLNTANVIDLGVLNEIEEINAIMIIGQTGSAGGHAVADVLYGREVPSGKLTDTWARHYEDYPNSKCFSHNDGNTDDEYYSEGIYVGYRYFDSFDVRPLYPFGFGIGYTEFSYIVHQVEMRNNVVSISVTVENIGKKYEGKEVIQVYFSAPEGELDKPKQELAAFAKTSMLKPGERETLKLEFRIADMASYNSIKSAWVLEKGQYLIRIGNSSRNTVLAAKIDLKESMITSQLKNVLSGDTEVGEIRFLNNKRTEDYIEDENVSQLYFDKSSFLSEECIYEDKRDALHTSRTDYITLDDVKDGNAKLEDLVAQLTVDEMAKLCVGIYRRESGRGSVVGFASKMVPGAAADTCSAFETDRKIPGLTFADGPAGLRLQPHFKVAGGKILPGGQMRGKHMVPFPENLPENTEDYYQYCTALPVATSLAQSWNLNILEKAGEIVGQEMKQYHIHLWLAPGMNIHRNPLCGRNFEYYSEDPFLTGKCAAAITKGVQNQIGIGTTIKHFAANNQEENRMFSNSHISERALREIYLKGFEIAVKEAQPYAIMTSYNLINGVHVANHYELLQKVAREEWGFKGVFMTDWFSSQDASDLGFYAGRYSWASSVLCIAAGNDLQMPGCSENVEDIIEAVKNGNMINLTDLQFCVCNILRLILKCTATS